MSITVNSTEDRFVVRIEGPLDAACALDARQSFESVIEAGSAPVDLDMSATTFIDSSGVGAIVALFKSVKANEGAFDVRGVSGQPLSIFKVLRLDKVFKL